MLVAEKCTFLIAKKCTLLFSDYKGTVRTEIQIHGDEEMVNDLMLDFLLEGEEEPFEYYEGFDLITLVYTSPDQARRALIGLYRRLCSLYPELIGQPTGLSFDDAGVLGFMESDIRIYSYDAR